MIRPTYIHPPSCTNLVKNFQNVLHWGAGAEGQRSLIMKVSLGISALGVSHVMRSIKVRYLLTYLLTYQSEYSM